ncbi:MAG: hypothetical protein K2M17_02360 [Bacilli bacterium]|nr:hypothetical protein [Bacilli bacterium]
MFNSESRQGMVFTAVEGRYELFDELEALTQGMQSSLENLSSDASIDTLELISKAQAVHECWKDLTYYLDTVIPMLDSLPDYPDYDE